MNAHFHLRRNTGRGFTLVELLVVVAVIIVLAGFLVPTIEGMLHTGRMLQCASRLRGIGLAAHVYAMDHDGQFSDSEKWIMFNADTRDGNPWSSSGVTNGELFTYMGEDPSLYLCPEFVRVHRMGLLPSIAGNKPYYSYSMNGFYRNRTGGWEGRPLLRRTSVEDWSSLGLFGEENPYVPIRVGGRHKYNRYEINDPHLGVANTDPSMGSGRADIDGLASYHRPRNRNLRTGDGFANVVFTDGSLRAIHSSNTIATFTPRAWQEPP